MNAAIKKNMPTIYAVITSAQAEILSKTGLDVVLMPRIHKGTIEEEIKNLFEAMCSCWGIDLEYASDRSRHEDRPIMRKILWMAGKRKHRDIPLKILGHATRTMDHASVLKGINQGYAWLEVQDNKFCSYYEKVKQYFDEPID